MTDVEARKSYIDWLNRIGREINASPRDLSPGSYSSQDVFNTTASESSSPRRVSLRSNPTGRIQSVGHIFYEPRIETQVTDKRSKRLETPEEREARVNAERGYTFHPSIGRSPTIPYRGFDAPKLCAHGGDEACDRCEVEEYPFRPELSTRSEWLAETLKSSSQPRWQELYDLRHKQKEKSILLAELKAQVDLQPCTFVPTINEGGRTGEILEDIKRQYGKLSDYHQHKKLEKESIKPAEPESPKWTFKPLPVPNFPEPKQQPKGVQSFFKRVLAGRKCQEERAPKPFKLKPGTAPHLATKNRAPQTNIIFFGPYPSPPRSPYDRPAFALD